MPVILQTNLEIAVWILLRLSLRFVVTSSILCSQQYSTWFDWCYFILLILFTLYMHLLPETPCVVYIYLHPLLVAS